MPTKCWCGRSWGNWTRYKAPAGCLACSKPAAGQPLFGNLRAAAECALARLCLRLAQGLGTEGSSTSPSPSLIPHGPVLAQHSLPNHQVLRSMYLHDSELSG